MAGDYCPKQIDIPQPNPQYAYEKGGYMTVQKVKKGLHWLLPALVMMGVSLLGPVRVAADPLPDTTPPVAEVLTVPSEKQVQESVQVVLLFTDDRMQESVLGGGGEYFLDTDPGVGNAHSLAMFGLITNNDTGRTYLAVFAQIGSDVPSGAHTVYARGHDAAGNWSQTISSPLNVVDTEAPVLINLTLSASQKPLAGSVGITATATDNGTVTDGEYYLDADPGLGGGTSLAVAGGAVTGTIGTNVSVGVHTVYARVRDAAGNWSNVLSASLIVFNPATTAIVTGTGNGVIIPSLANGDVLPGLIDANQNDKADFAICTWHYRCPI